MKLHFLGVLGLAMVCAASQASLTGYFGLDEEASSSDPHTNSNAAAALYDAAATGSGLIDFEAQSVGTFSNIQVAPGVFLAGSDVSSAPQTIIDTPLGQESHFGYNITSGGKNWASFFGGTMTFTFTTPVDGFGAYFTGIQNPLGGSFNINFQDGASNVTILSFISDGGVQFLGFYDPGASITSITLNGNFDIMGMDDVRYHTAVPEPASMTALGIGALALIRRRRNGK